MRKLSLAVPALLLTLTITACGGGVNASTYIEQVTKAQQAAEVTASAQTSEIATATTPEDIAAKLSAFGASMKSSSGKLAAIKPPEKVAKEHQQYVDAVSTFGTQLQALAADAKTTVPDELKPLLARANQISADLSTAETKIVTDINNKLQS